MKKKLLNFLTLCLCLFIFIFGIRNVFADSGWDSSYDSGSSWSGSSSSSSSWGSSSSSSSSWDSDYSYGSSSSNSGGDLSAGETFIIAIFLIGGMVVFVIVFSKPSYTFSNNISSSNNYSYYKDISLEDLQKVLPNETLEDLKLKLYQRFKDIQDAWENFNYDALREMCTDELAESYISQLDTLKLKNGKNIMSDFNPIDIKITSAKLDNDLISVVVYANITFYDYVINEKTGEVIRGNKSRKVNNHYIMTFVVANESITKCPGCGAELKMNTSGVCEYCRMKIVKNASDFVLSKKTNINR